MEKHALNPDDLTTRLLLENKAWSEEILSTNPDFFHNLAKGQHPDFLWIGCSDSRVPAETIVNAHPGQIFVHRNIANQVITTDFNCLSVIQYAVEVLKVKHVIVCGHYGCGGVKAALQSQNSGLTITNKWLMHIKDIYRLHKDELKGLDEEATLASLIQLNIREQVQRIAHLSIIQKAWKESQLPTLHGWVYGLENGILEQLITLDHTTQLEPIYRYND
ncbi:MAG: carbonic anhydrase [Verrucomicrobiota bacterium]